MKPTQNDLLVRVLPEIVKKGEKIEAKGTDMFIAQVVKVGPQVKAIHVGETVIFPPFGIANVSVSVGGGTPEPLIVVNEDLIKLHDGKKAK